MFDKRVNWLPWSISKFSKRQYFQRKLNFLVFLISILNLVHGSIFWENSVCDFQSIKNPVELNSLLLKLAFQNISQGSIFIVKQTAVHIACQNTVHGSFSREKQTAAHIAFRNTVQGSFFREKQTAVYIAFQNISQGSIFIEKQTAVHIASQNTVCGTCF